MHLITCERIPEAQQVVVVGVHGTRLVQRCDRKSWAGVGSMLARFDKRVLEDNFSYVTVLCKFVFTILVAVF